MFKLIKKIASKIKEFDKILKTQRNLKYTTEKVLLFILIFISMQVVGLELINLVKNTTLHGGIKIMYFKKNNFIAIP